MNIEERAFELAFELLEALDRLIRTFHLDRKAVEEAYRRRKTKGGKDESRKKSV